MENACLRISRFFENDLSNAAWHRELLDRMILDVPGVRMALLTRDEHAAVDELRAFRHVFRNLYNRPLDTVRLMALQAKVPGAVSGFIGALFRYCDFLESLKTSLME